MRRCKLGRPLVTHLEVIGASLLDGLCHCVYLVVVLAEWEVTELLEHPVAVDRVKDGNVAFVYHRLNSQRSDLLGAEGVTGLIRAALLRRVSSRAAPLAAFST